MKAVIRHSFGDSDVLEVAETPIPEPGPAEVRVRVAAAGLDRGSWHRMTGRPTLTRLVFGLRRPRDLGLGLDLCGIVDAVGTKVTAWQPGDRVFGTAAGALAQFVIAAPDRLASPPDEWNDIEAGTTGVSGVAALRALRDKAQVKPGHRVLVIGASGGVGTFAVQIAAAMGCHVTASCSADKAESVHSLGADEVLDRRAARLPADHSFDAVLAIGGSHTWNALRRATRSEGRVVLVGSADILHGLLWTSVRGALTFNGPSVSTLASVEHSEDLQTLAHFGADGRVTSHIDSTYDLARVRAAMDRLSSGSATGKIAITIPGEN